MKAISLWTALWLVLFSGMAATEAAEALGPKCQKLAHEFADNPDSLNEDQLKQLQFCIAQTLKQRAETNPPEQLKGTIIEPPLPSIEAPGTTPPAPTHNPDAQK